MVRNAVESIGKGRSADNGRVVVVVIGHATVLLRADGNLALSSVRRSDLAASMGTGRTTSTTIDRGAVAVVIGLNLCLDAASVGRGPDARQQGTDVLHETVLHEVSGILQGRLNDVVGEAVAQKAIHLAWGEELFGNEILRPIVRAAKALLDHIRAELVARQGADATAELNDDGLSVLRLVEVDDVLNHVVAERILDKGDGVLRDLANQPVLLFAGSMIDAALENAAAVTMGTDLDAIVTDSIEDELRITRAQLVEALLDDVVAVQILDQINDAVAESVDNDVNLLGRRNELNHLLQSAGSMLVQRNADHVLSSVLDKNGALFIVAILQELLAQVVAEWIGHQLDHVLIGLEPDHVNLLGVAVLELLLEVAAAMLILAERVDLATNSLERQVVEAAHS